jgi:long-subunit acyl-CoA synthetase (AMP-forming)
MSLVQAGALHERVALLADGLRAARPRMLGLLADNSAAWAVADLAAERAGVPLVPLPAFFTAQQLQHVCASSGMDALFCDRPQTALALGFRSAGAPDGAQLPWFRRDAEAVPLPAGTAKITFTSGTTGAPKGVCLSAAQQDAAAGALAQATRHLGLERHLCLLPLPVLLENVAGVRAPMVAGAACCVPPLAEVGVGGAIGFDPLACLAAMERWQAHSVILLPQMMLALTAAIEGGARPPSRLRFAAVGGARIPAALVLRAREAGLPVYEGYGLSECASVVSLNVPGADRPGSVGRPLPHARVCVEADGEVTVSGNRFLGYLGTGAGAGPGAALRTGDLGRLDAEGFLHIEGRRKHVLITSFGRNVAPEWPEAELAGGGVIAQAVVFGDARPQLCAVVVSRDPAASDAAIEAEVRCVNARLPDYARIAFWIRAEAPFSAADGSATSNGRVRRDVVSVRYGERMESRYSTLSGVEHDAFL